jgi:hypothetical protein
VPAAAEAISSDKGLEKEPAPPKSKAASPSRGLALPFGLPGYMLYVFIGLATVLIISGALFASVLLNQLGSRLNTEGPADKQAITLGSEVQVANGTVGSQGGTIKVDKPGDPVNGLQIEVPKDAYTDTKSFKISYSPILKHNLGENFNPITPLIKVDNGGDYSSLPMKVEVPVKTEPGHFAVGFYYDSATGKLEAIPTVAQNGDSVTLYMQHFSSFSISDMIEERLNGTIDTNFKPGVDDWNFTNNGSYITYGHCEGQSVTAMWYYYNKPDGQGHLYSRPAEPDAPKGNTGGYYTVDGQGYRFCSTVQEDIKFLDFANSFWGNLAGQITPETTKNLFAAAMLITREPQLVVIYGVDPANNQPAGHAIIAYGMNNGTLLVADPNFHGVARSVQWSGQGYQIYYSGANARQAAQYSIPYDRFYYFAKSTSVDWKTINSRWQELKAKTAGNDRFPIYKILVIDDDGKEIELEDGYNLKNPKKEIKVKLDNPDFRMDLVEDGTKVAPFGDNITYALVGNGKTRLGFEIWGDAANSQNKGWPWIDYKVIDITIGAEKQELKIAPSETEGCPGEPYTFSLKATKMPSKVKYQWTFEGDTKYTGETATHAFKANSSGSVVLEAYAEKQVKPIASDKLSFKVKTPTITIIAEPANGVAKETSKFSVDPACVPARATYAWTFGDGSTGEGSTVSHPFNDAKSYPVSVTATWAGMDAAKTAYSADGKLTYAVTAGEQASLEIIPPPDIATDEAKIDIKYLFDSTGKNIPENATYTWYQDGQAAGNEQSAFMSFKSNGPHNVGIKAIWTSPQGAQREKTAALAFTIGKAIVILQIRPDELIEANGAVADVKYFFSLIHDGFPANTKYNWYVNGKLGGSGVEGWFKFKTAKPYTIKVVATWKDSKGSDQNKDDLYICDVKALTIKILAPGKMGATDQAYTFDAKYGGLPSGAKVEWYFEGGKKYDGNSATHTFTSTGDKTVRVQITSGAGIDSLASDEVIFSVRSLGIKIVSPLPAGQKGVSGVDYIFTLDNSKIPTDARASYAWFVNGSPAGGGLRLPAPAVKAGTYSVLAVCTLQSGTSSVKLEDNLTFEVAEAAVVRISPAGGTGEMGKAYTFTASGTGLPAGAQYEWYFEGGKKYRGTSATHTFDSNGDKTVLVMVYSGNALEPVARAEANFKIGTPAAATASIKIDAPLPVGVIGASYSFTATTAGIPANASYTWDFGDSTGQAQGKASPPHAYKTAGDFPVKVVARWVEAGKSRELSDSATKKIAADTPVGARPEVNFAVWRWSKVKVMNELVKKRDYCQDYSIKLYKEVKGTNVLSESGSSWLRNGSFDTTLSAGHYMYEVNYKYVDPGADSGRRTGYFDVFENGNNQVDVETPPYEKYL